MAAARTGDRASDEGRAQRDRPAGWGFGTSRTSRLPHTMTGAAVAQRDVSGLDDDRKDALREQLLATLPVAADGSLHVTDRAWAVRGTKGMA